MASKVKTMTSITKIMDVLDSVRELNFIQVSDTKYALKLWQSSDIHDVVIEREFLQFHNVLVNCIFTSFLIWWLSESDPSNVNASTLYSR